MGKKPKDEQNIARRDLSNIWSQMDEVMTSQTPINNIQDDVAIIDNIKLGILNDYLMDK